MMRVKYDVSSLFKSFIPMILNQFEKHIQIVRSNNGSEFKIAFMENYTKFIGFFIKVLSIYTTSEWRG